MTNIFTQTARVNKFLKTKMKELEENYPINMPIDASTAVRAIPQGQDVLYSYAVQGTWTDINAFKSLLL